VNAYARVLTALVLALLSGGCAAPIGNPVDGLRTRALIETRPVMPAAGDTAVYRVINAYNGEVRGEIRYRVDKVESASVVVSVSASSPYMGVPPTEVYTMEGNWLRHPVVNHDRPTDYDFAPPYPAYPFPLDIGKSWSMRVNATNPMTGQRRSVRVDGQVLGAERISTPAGTFDTIKIRRLVYAGDWEGPLRETQILHIDWYAPALGRSVRAESSSQWLDVSRCSRSGCALFRGDWEVLELVSHSAARISSFPAAARAEGIASTAD
jgi:hypothetical protein